MYQPSLNRSLNIIFIIFGTVACESGAPKQIEPSNGVAGESMAGESMAGESTAGESMAGESTAGESTAGESTAGESTAGEPMAGEPMAGEPMAGEAVAGESMAGESMAWLDLPDEPVEGCVGPMVSSIADTSMAATNNLPCVTCVGSSPPNFILHDVNPGSCGVNQFYGINAFEGAVTLVVLLRSSCGYCQAQLEKLEQIRFELLAEGHTVWIIIINQTNTESNLSALTDRSMSAVLQDIASVNAWEAMGDISMIENGEGDIVESRVGGDKDDMYIYGIDNTLARFLDDDNPDFSLNLSTTEGYMNLKTSLLEVLNSNEP